MMKSVLTLATAALIALGSLTNASAAPLTDSARYHAFTGRSLTGHSRSKPIAYGYVLANGTATSGTAHFTAYWDTTANWYVITMTGVDYYYSNFSTNVTTTEPGGVSCQTDSSGGNLLVICYNAAGSQVQADFQFVTF